MARYLLIDPPHQRCAQVSVQKFEVAEPLMWIDVSDNPADDRTLENSTYVNGQIVPPPPQHRPDPDGNEPSPLKDAHDALFKNEPRLEDVIIAVRAILTAITPKPF